MKNQYTLIIDNNNFLTQYIDILTASKELSGAAFKMYIYLCQEENNSEINFSPTKIKDDLGIAIGSIHNGFRQLFEKGYLEKIKDDIFIFHSTKK